MSRRDVVLAALVASGSSGCGAASPGPERPAPVAITIAAPPAEAVSAEPPDRTARPPGSIFLAYAAAQVSVADGDTVSMPLMPFSLRFELEHYREKERVYHAARVCGSVTRAPLEIQPGRPQHGDRIHPFGPASGFASNERGYDVFQMSTEGHHYLYFHPKDSSSRVRELERVGPTRSFVQFDVESAYVPERGLHYEMWSFPFDRVHLAVFIDDNLDSVIQDSELTRFTIELE